MDTKGLLMIDPEGCVAYVDAQMADLLGLAGCEIVGHSCFEYVSDEDLESAHEQFEHPGREPFHVRLRRYDDSESSVKVNGHLVVTTAGAIIGTVATATETQ